MSRATASLVSLVASQGSFRAQDLGGFGAQRAKHGWEFGNERVNRMAHVGHSVVLRTRLSCTPKASESSRPVKCNQTHACAPYEFWRYRIEESRSRGVGGDATICEAVTSEFAGRLGAPDSRVAPLAVSSQDSGPYKIKPGPIAVTKRKAKPNSEMAAALRMLSDGLGPHYDHRRTKQGRGDVTLVTNSLVSITMPPGSTHFDGITEFARLAHPPFAVKSLSLKLKHSRSIRGRAYFGHAGRVIEEILVNYPTLRWWVEAEGLVIEEVSGDLGDISEFDRVAGALVQAHWKNGRLAEASLLAIAEKLDEEGLTLRDNLQPAQWKPVGKYNREHPRAPIRTFRQAVGWSHFARSVRRRLYLARDRYEAALHAVRPIETEWF